MENVTDYDLILTTSNSAVKTGLGLTVNELCNCYFLPIVCGVGIMGNIANLITLASPKLRAVSYMYLRALGVADLLCMFFVLIFVFFEILKLMNLDRIYGDYVAAWYRAHTMLPLINASVSAGILIVVALTVERYISICWPIFFRQWNLSQRAVPFIVTAYVVPFLLYIPMCWQYKVVFNQTNLTNGFVPYTVEDNVELLHSKTYKAYKWTRETLLKFIPIVTLAVLSLLIVAAFRKIRDRRKRLNNTNSSSFTSNISASSINRRNQQQQQFQQTSREQRNILFLLVAIAIMFFICNTPAAINLLFISEEKKKLPGYLFFRAIANLMEITNHALNFYVFCLCSRDYRKTFLYTFPCVKKVSDGTAVVKRRMSETITKMQTNVIEGGRIITTRRGSRCVEALNGLYTDFASRLDVMKGSIYLYPINEEDVESDTSDRINGVLVGQYSKLITSQSQTAFSPTIEDIFVDDEDNVN